MRVADWSQQGGRSPSSRRPGNHRVDRRFVAFFGLAVRVEPGQIKAPARRLAKWMTVGRAKLVGNFCRPGEVGGGDLIVQMAQTELHLIDEFV